jgi:hypothetical protein
LNFYIFLSNHDDKDEMNKKYRLFEKGENINSEFGKIRDGE